MQFILRVVLVTGMVSGPSLLWADDSKIVRPSSNTADCQKIIDPAHFKTELTGSEILRLQQNMEKKLFQNLFRPDVPLGIVIASPSQENPNYWFHWVRDAALTMDYLIDLYLNTSGELKEKLFQLITAFIEVSYRQQLATELPLHPQLPSHWPRSSHLGEPKFYVQNWIFPHRWGRPQNDGPALRASALMKFAHALKAEQHSPVYASSYIKNLFIDPHHPLRVVIQKDLKYTFDNAHEVGYDYWEEVLGLHFTDHMAKRKSLTLGSAWMNLINDKTTAAKYSSAAKSLNDVLETHWSPDLRYILNTLKSQDGIDYKKSNLDMATLLAVLHSRLPGESFDVLDSRVLATAESLRSTFEELYPINDNGLPGIAHGRYPEDRYNGHANETYGNPWVLTTNAMAEFYYLVAIEILNRGYLNIDSINDKFFAFIASSTGTEWEPQVGLQITSAQEELGSVIRSLLKAGDYTLKRAWYHGNSDGSFNEQINKDTGFMQGAHNLTWSYVSFLTALDARQRLLERFYLTNFFKDQDL